MKTENENKKNAPDERADSRRGFLKLGLLTGGAALAVTGVTQLLGETADSSGEKVKVLTPEGNLVEIDSAQVKKASCCDETQKNVREGVPGKKFVMVIDLARCANERACVEGCQEMHHKTPPTEWIKVKRMEDEGNPNPYWLPQPCFHCDNPPCTKVCPVDATFKREDGLVLIDNDRCIGCRFCMAACPYNSRSFNWAEPEVPEGTVMGEYSIEKSFPAKKGTVEKCDFCPDMAREGKLPDCVTACPNGTIFFGDANEDAVTNGEDTFRLSELLKKRAGYRLLEDLGTEPRVYYLPPVNRNFPFEEDTVNHNTEDYQVTLHKKL